MIDTPERPDNHDRPAASTREQDTLSVEHERTYTELTLNYAIEDNYLCQLTGKKMHVHVSQGNICFTIDGNTVALGPTSTDILASNLSRASRELSSQNLRN